eukprot:3566669-Rhodomonas_salina.1
MRASPHRICQCPGRPGRVNLNQFRFVTRPVRNLRIVTVSPGGGDGPGPPCPSPGGGDGPGPPCPAMAGASLSAAASDTRSLP